jgi:hypothetical protein
VAAEVCCPTYKRPELAKAKANNNSCARLMFSFFTFYILEIIYIMVSSY